jgi:TPR repeat protein
MKSVMVLAALLTSSAATSVLAAKFVAFDPSRYSQEITECDRLASHPDDPFKLAAGVSEGKVDLAKAIPACLEAVTRDPKNPRLNYMYGRVLGYAGRGAEALPYREAAVDGDYPQALFVIGYITLYGYNFQPKDVCRAGELLHRSALHDRIAGQLGFPRYVLEGRFDTCPGVRRDPAEMLEFVAAARKQFGSDYYKGLLADALEDDLKRLIQQP